MNKQLEQICTKPAPMYSAEKTRTLLQNIFEEKGWQYECQENGALLVTYQGEHFVIEFSDDGCHFRIWDLGWHEVALENLANFALVRTAVNECNLSPYAVVMYGIDNEEKVMRIHTKRDVEWFHLISDLKFYLQNALDSMLSVHHHFYQIMERLRQDEYAKNNDIGFVSK